MLIGRIAADITLFLWRWFISEQNSCYWLIIIFHTSEVSNEERSYLVWMLTWKRYLNNELFG